MMDLQDAELDAEIDEDLEVVDVDEIDDVEESPGQDGEPVALPDAEDDLDMALFVTTQTAPGAGQTFLQLDSNAEFKLAELIRVSRKYDADFPASILLPPPVIFALCLNAFAVRSEERLGEFNIRHIMCLC